MTPKKGRKGKEKPAKASLNVPRMTEADLEEFVKDYLAGHITTSENVHPANLMTLVFMPLAFGNPFEGHPLEEVTAKVGAIYGNMRKHKTIGRSINGYPIFFECAFVHKEDWRILAETINRERAKPTRIKLER